jgi:hypothetical protein
MKRAESIYRANKAKIDELLRDKSYPESFQGLLSAIRDLGDGFLFRVFNFSFSNWENDEGKTNWWTSFKNIFHKAANTTSTTSDVVNGADNWINPDQPTQQTPETKPEESDWNPNLLWWMLAGLALILILLLIFIFTRKSAANA